MAKKPPEALYRYFLLLEVDPKQGQDYLRWLEDKHIKDVLTAPGFLWARRIVLDEAAADGWQKFMVVYGLRSREDFQNYQTSDLLKGFADELKPFEGVFRITRHFGPVDLLLG